MQYRLRTLLTILALGPPMVAGVGVKIHQAYWKWRWQAAAQQAGQVQSGGGTFLGQAASADLRSHPLLDDGRTPPPPIVLRGTLDELPPRPDITPP